MPIELKGLNYYSKVFKRINYRLSNNTFWVVIIYQCEDAENCDYHLHQQCYHLSDGGLPSFIEFPFLESKKCDFVFHQEATGGDQRACYACGKDVKGWFYQCKMCKKPHYLHPCCAQLPIKQKGEKGIVLYLKAKTSSKCLECGSVNISQGLRGWFYVSNGGKHCYHVACVMDMVWWWSISYQRN